jgi:hypothetical protein
MKRSGVQEIPTLYDTRMSFVMSTRASEVQQSEWHFVTCCTFTLISPVACQLPSLRTIPCRRRKAAFFFRIQVFEITLPGMCRSTTYLGNRTFCGHWHFYLWDWVEETVNKICKIIHKIRRPFCCTFALLNAVSVTGNIHENWLQ